MWGVKCRPLCSQRSWDIITVDPLYSCFCILGFNHGVVLHIFTEKKTPHVSEPVHFKPMLFQGQLHVFEPPQKSNGISNLLFGWTKKQIVVGTTFDFTLIFMSWAVSQSRFAMVIKHHPGPQISQLLWQWHQLHLGKDRALEVRQKQLVAWWEIWSHTPVLEGSLLRVGEKTLTHALSISSLTLLPGSCWEEEMCWVLSDSLRAPGL